MGDTRIGCSGGIYPEPAEKGGWTRTFYPDSMTREVGFLLRVLQYSGDGFNFLSKILQIYEQRDLPWHGQSNA